MKRLTFLFLNLFIAGLLFSQTLITVSQFNAGVTREDDNFIYSTVNGQNYAVDKATRRNYRIWIRNTWRRFNIEAQNANGLQYTVKDRAITIDGYTGSATAIVIPATINGLPVVAIGDSAFTLYTMNLSLGPLPDYGLTSITIPNGVKTIGRTAFKGNKQLTSVTIPDSVTTIGSDAFGWCGLTSVTIPNGVATIGQFAFSSNQLTSVTIPNSVTTIEGGAFVNNQLTSVTIPDNVTSMGYGVFSGNRLISASVGIGLTSNIAYVFAPNDNAPNVITKINVSSGNQEYSSVDGVVYNKTRTTLILWPGGKISVNIPFLGKRRFCCC